MSSPHAHPHTMRKTHAKFQNNWYKTARGVALTRDTHCLYNQGEKWLSWQCRKSDKNWSNNYVQSTCTSSYHEENTCKVSKQWTYERKRTNRRKLARLCLPAKAGVTNMWAVSHVHTPQPPTPPPPPPPKKKKNTQKKKKILYLGSLSKFTLLESSKLDL